MEQIVGNWRKSTFSGNGGDCVEVAQTADGTILLRDTKANGCGPTNRFTAGEWRAFILGVHSGEFNLDEAGKLV